MATTTNFGWETPDDTDLVKDGALAMRTLGNAIDTSLVDLKGGTSGQILSKNSNTDMDFVWITNDVGDITNVAVTSPITGGGSSGSVTIGIEDATTAQKGAVQLTDSTSSTSTTTAATPNSVKSAYDLANGAIPKTLTTTTGDLIYASAANTPARLGVGTTGQVLTVSGGVPTWAAAAAGGKVLQVVQGIKTDTASTTSQTFVTTGLSVSITPSSTNSKILVFAMTSFGLDPNQSNVYASLYRDSTAIIQGDAASNRPRITTMNYVGNGNFGGQTSIVYLDSPSSTSALTYAVYYRSSEGGTVYVNRTSGDNNATTYSPRSASVIVAMEIGA